MFETRNCLSWFDHTRNDYAFSLRGLGILCYLWSSLEGSALDNRSWSMSRFCLPHRRNPKHRDSLIDEMFDDLTWSWIDCCGNCEDAMLDYYKKLGQAPSFIERYPNNQDAPNQTFLLRENALLRALRDLGVRIEARWECQEEYIRNVYHLNGKCLVCDAVIKYSAFGWELPSLQVESYLSEAIQCAHMPQTELDESLIETMLALELFSNPI
jgi:hypothetical protein